MSDRGWNERYEQFFTTYKDKCYCYAWMYAEQSKKNSRINDWISIPIMLISVLLGSTSLIMGVFGGDVNTSTNLLVVGSFNLIITLLEGLNSKFQYKEKATTADRYNRMYSALYRKIDTELAKPAVNRETPDKLTNGVVSEYEQLANNRPTIQSSVIAAFNKTFANSTITKPLIASDPTRLKGLDVDQMRQPNDIPQRALHRSVSFLRLSSMNVANEGQTSIDSQENEFSNDEDDNNV